MDPIKIKPKNLVIGSGKKIMKGHPQKKFLVMLFEFKGQPYLMEFNEKQIKQITKKIHGLDRLFGEDE